LTIEITEQNLKLSINTNEVKISCALRSDVFSSFKLKEDVKVEKFNIPLNALINCLGIYGNTKDNIDLNITYDGLGPPLLLILASNRKITDCFIRTFQEDENPNNIFFYHDASICKMVVSPMDLYEAFSELDWSNEHSIVFEIFPEEPYFKLSSYNQDGTFEVIISKNSKVIQNNQFECGKNVRLVYKNFNLLPCIRALKKSKETTLQINEIGILYFKHQINIEKVDYFIDYYINQTIKEADVEF